MFVGKDWSTGRENESAEPIGPGDELGKAPVRSEEHPELAERWVRRCFVIERVEL